RRSSANVPFVGTIHFKTRKMSSNLDSMETQLELFTENVRQIGIIVTDFQPQGQTVLNQKINQMVQSMQEIDRLRNQIQDIQVPLEVFEYIDEGRNPQLYTKDCMEKALSKNEHVKGKIDSYRRFKAMLLVELSKVFPNEMAKYRAIRGDERTS
ncbi:Mediator of RNA polymerase II transcription subunit 10-like protein, partial [Leptotrombidium deliense]